MAGAEAFFSKTHGRTIVFVDEIHRFNKAQQDAFLPYLESGVIMLIGATTENPSFEVIGPLLSRSKVYVLNSLKAGRDSVYSGPRPSGHGSRSGQDAPHSCGGGPGPDCIACKRRFANCAEICLNSPQALASSQSGSELPALTLANLEAALQAKTLPYDKGGEQHYNLISALHKSMRNSDPDAALYWMGRMLEGGEDPIYVARRMVRFASEDIGLADVRALNVALAATEAVRLSVFRNASWHWRKRRFIYPSPPNPTLFIPAIPPLRRIFRRLSMSLRPAHTQCSDTPDEGTWLWRWIRICP